MSKWDVYGEVRGNKYLGQYEADTKEQAEEMALKKNGDVAFCHQCSGECEDAEVVKAAAEPAFIEDNSEGEE